MRGFFTIAIFLISVASMPANAEEGGAFRFGGDAFVAGQTAIHDAPDTDDLFIAGQRVRVEADVTGSVHAAGQSIRLESDAGGDVYAAGQDVEVSGNIAGDLSVFGQDLILSGAVEEALRAAGSVVELTGSVGDYAILAGEEVQIGGVISGDVSLVARDVEFLPGARIGGTLTLYEDEGEELEVPGSVLPADRIMRVSVEEWSHDEWQMPVPSGRQLIGRFLGSVLMVALLAALIAALVPERLADMRRMLLDSPFRALGIGFVAQSAIVGSMFIVALTLIGLLLVPGILVIAGFVALAGYIVGAYAFGVGLTLIAGREEPDSLQDRAIAAGVGALAVGLLGLVPVLGWILILALSLSGVGVLVAEFILNRGRDTDAV